MDFSLATETGAESLLGVTTGQCISQGSYHQLCGAVERVFRRLQIDQPDMAMILTGGDAERIQAGLALDSLLDTDLVLKGLASILRRNRLTSAS